MIKSEVFVRRATCFGNLSPCLSVSWSDTCVRYLRFDLCEIHALDIRGCIDSGLFEISSVLGSVCEIYEMLLLYRTAEVLPLTEIAEVVLV